VLNMKEENLKARDRQHKQKDELTVWLSRQEQTVSALIELALKKRSLLVNPTAEKNELNELNGIIKEENQLMMQLREAEKKLLEISQESTSTLVETQCFTALQADFMKLRWLNETNRTLLGSLLQYINISLDLLCQDKSGEIYRESFDKKGEVEKVVERPGQFNYQV
jgi:hypothetical protein